jgi:hypothetical protein
VHFLDCSPYVVDVLTKCNIKWGSSIRMFRMSRSNAFPDLHPTCRMFPVARVVIVVLVLVVPVVPAAPVAFAALYVSCFFYVNKA